MSSFGCYSKNFILKYFYVKGVTNNIFKNYSQLPFRDIKNSISSDTSVEMFSQFRSSMEEFIKVVEGLSDSFTRLKVAVEKSQLILVTERETEGVKGLVSDVISYSFDDDEEEDSLKNGVFHYSCDSNSTSSAEDFSSSSIVNT